MFYSHGPPHPFLSSLLSPICSVFNIPRFEVAVTSTPFTTLNPPDRDPKDPRGSGPRHWVARCFLHYFLLGACQACTSSPLEGREARVKSREGQAVSVAHILTPVGEMMLDGLSYMMVEEVQARDIAQYDVAE